MELVNQIVIHKLWGEGFVSRHDDSGFFVTFGGEEKPFSYPDSFAAFLRFADPQLQNTAEVLLAKKAEEKSKAMASWHSSSYQREERPCPCQDTDDFDHPNLCSCRDESSTDPW